VNFQSVVIEGGDQVGKGDTCSSLISQLEEEQIPVFCLSFPQYATPFGYLIRRVLTEDNREGLEKRDIEIREILFALDRLQAAESILRCFKNARGIFLWDRSPFSNALTISYGLTKVNDFTKIDVEELAKNGLSMEDFLINTFNLNNCVVELAKRDSYWSSLRNGGEDQYESKDVQERVSEVYKIFSDIVGEGWSRVFVDKEGKNNNEVTNTPNWRDRNDRDSEVLTFIKQRLSLDNLRNPENHVVERIDVLDIAKYVYGLDIADMEIVSDFYLALDKNEKNQVYEKGADIAKYIVSKSKEINFENHGVIDSIRNIIDAYPECLSIIEYYYGNNFRRNFEESIYD
jgi:thymidylate kinase